jgi:hypothetical protein
VDRHWCFQNDHVHHVLQRVWKCKYTDRWRSRTKWFCRWIVVCQQYTPRRYRDERYTVPSPDKRSCLGVILLVKVLWTPVHMSSRTSVYSQTSSRTSVCIQIVLKKSFFPSLCLPVLHSVHKESWIKIKINFEVNHCLVVVIIIFIYKLFIIKGVGVMKDKELKLEDTEVSHTLGGSIKYT